MKVHISMVADLSIIPGIMQAVALGKVEAGSIDIQPAKNGEITTEAIAPHQPLVTKRKRGRPRKVA